VWIAQLPNVVLIELCAEAISYLCPGVQPRMGGFGEDGRRLWPCRRRHIVGCAADPGTPRDGKRGQRAL
jgi:hypothetical protein